MTEKKKIDLVDLFLNIIIIVFAIIVIAQEANNPDFTNLGTICALTLLALRNVYRSIRE